LQREREEGHLAKGAKKAKQDAKNASAPSGSNERVYVPLEDEDVVRAARDSNDDEIVEQERREAGDKPREMVQTPSMREVFGPRGLLERCMTAGYEHRPAQLEMAEMVHDAFQSHRHAIVEAGTGTGKTLAYLLPVICSGRRVVISTATKSLQEQLYQKDVPFLQKYFAPNLKVAVMKGRSNFLCRSKLDQMADQRMLKGMDEQDAFRGLQKMASDKNRKLTEIAQMILVTEDILRVSEKKSSAGTGDA
jgi:hypothetical protein